MYGIGEEELVGNDVIMGKKDDERGNVMIKGKRSKCWREKKSWWCCEAEGGFVEGERVGKGVVTG